MVRLLFRSPTLLEHGPDSWELLLAFAEQLRKEMGCWSQLMRQSPVMGSPLVRSQLMATGRGEVNCFQSAGKSVADFVDLLYFLLILCEY